MSPLFLSVALTTFAANTGEVTFRGAVVAPSCSYHPGAATTVLHTEHCYQDIKPTVAGPSRESDPATVELLGTNVPTWHLTYR